MLFNRLSDMRNAFVTGSVNLSSPRQPATERLWAAGCSRLSSKAGMLQLPHDSGTLNTSPDIVASLLADVCQVPTHFGKLEASGKNGAGTAGAESMIVPSDCKPLEHLVTKCMLEGCLEHQHFLWKGPLPIKLTEPIDKESGLFVFQGGGGWLYPNDMCFSPSQQTIHFPNAVAHYISLPQLCADGSPPTCQEPGPHRESLGAVPGARPTLCGDGSSASCQGPGPHLESPGAVPRRSSIPPIPEGRPTLCADGSSPDENHLCRGLEFNQLPGAIISVGHKRPQ